MFTVKISQWTAVLFSLVFLLYCAQYANSVEYSTGYSINIDNIAHDLELSDWRFYTSTDGMKESWARSVTVGFDGTILINHGTVDEMSYYDGFNFYKIPSPSPQNKVYKSKTGELWAVYSDDSGGFQVYRNEKWHRKKIDLKNVLINEDFTFLPAFSNFLYYLLPDSVMIFDFDTGTSKLLIDVGNTQLSQFSDMIYSNDDCLWVAGGNGVIKFRVNEHSGVYKLELNEYVISKDFEIRNVDDLFENSDDELFSVAESLVTGKSVLMKFSDNSWEKITNTGTTNIDKNWSGYDQSLWLKTSSSNKLSRNWDLLQLKGRHVAGLKKNRILSGAFHDVAVDSNGVFWLATAKGLARHAPHMWREPANLAALNENFNSAIEDKTGTLYFSYSDTLLVLQVDTWKKIGTSLQSNPWTEMCLVSDNIVIIGSRAGSLALYDNERDMIDIISHPSGYEIQAISQHSDDKVLLMVASNDGSHQLELFDGINFKVLLADLAYSDFGVSTQKLFLSKNGQYWFLGVEGLIRYRNGKLEKVGVDDGYLVGGAFCFLEMKDGTIWIGGRDMIQKYDGHEWTLVKSSGLETVRSMVECCDGSIFVSSGSGLHRYNQGSWVRNTWEDGLPDASVNGVLEDSTNRFWAYTENGIHLYHSDADENPPETYVNNNDNVHNVSHVGEGRIYFTGRDKWDYTTKDRLLFSWSLDDGPWSIFQQVTSVGFAGLSAGEHSFKVRSMDRSMNVDQSPAQFRFEVLLPWYREAGFLTVFSGSVIIILLSIIFAITRHLRLEKLVILRTAKLRDEMDERSKVEEKYQTLFETSRDALGVTTPEGLIVDVNGAWLTMFGYARDEVLGRNILMIYSEKEKREPLRQELTENGFLQDFDVNLITKQGKVIDCRITANVSLNNDGSVCYFQTIIRDMTERKHLENQLAQAQKMESIGQLAGGVAHDFNNIIQAISLNTELTLLSIPTDSPLNESLMEIQSNTDRAADLTRQLLAFSRRQIIAPEIVNLNDIISNMKKMLGRLISENIEVVTFLSDDLWLVNIDKGQIEQLVTNLAVNARDAMPDGGKLTIETTNGTMDEEYAQTHQGVVLGEYVMLAVSDTGIGMDEKTQSQIFEPFFTTKGVGKGTGLGLSTCYGIVKQNKGNVWVYSEPGTGTTFKIYFPRAETDIAKNAVKEMDVMGLPNGSETILLVEDEPSLLNANSKVLLLKGYRVMTASNGLEALPIIEKYGENIDLMLTDVIMPKMGGIELVEKLHKTHPNVKVLYMSGYTDNAIVHNGVLDANVAYIQKPAAVSAILRKVRQLLDE